MDAATRIASVPDPSDGAWKSIRPSTSPSTTVGSAVASVSTVPVVVSPVSRVAISDSLPPPDCARKLKPPRSEPLASLTHMTSRDPNTIWLSASSGILKSMPIPLLLSVRFPPSPGSHSNVRLVCTDPAALSRSRTRNARKSTVPAPPRSVAWVPSRMSARRFGLTSTSDPRIGSPVPSFTE